MTRDGVLRQLSCAVPGRRKQAVRERSAPPAARSCMLPETAASTRNPCGSGSARQRPAPVAATTPATRKALTRSRSFGRDLAHPSTTSPDRTPRAPPTA
jgi:hypothetical protein